MLSSQPRISSSFYPTVNLFLRLDLASKKLAKGECVAKKARDKEPLLVVPVVITKKGSPH